MKINSQAIDGNLLVTDHIKKFGDYVWVIENIPEFNKRLEKRAIELGIVIKHGLIEYRSLANFHGIIPQEKGV